MTRNNPHKLEQAGRSTTYSDVRRMYPSYLLLGPHNLVLAGLCLEFYPCIFPTNSKVEKEKNFVRRFVWLGAWNI
jgi:hypothetical protein